MIRALLIPVRFVTGAAIGATLGLAMLLAAPNVVGGHSFTVMSGSMTPTIRTGDVVLDERIRPLQAHIGDIVTFKDPKKPRLLTHRLRSVRRQGDKLLMVTKGDANNTVEKWVVPVRGEIGRVRYRVPKVGRLLWRTRTPQAKILIVALPALLLGVLQLLAAEAARAAHGRARRRCPVAGVGCSAVRAPSSARPLRPASSRARRSRRSRPSRSTRATA